jgi:hypothetical protein
VDMADSQWRSAGQCGGANRSARDDDGGRAECRIRVASCAGGGDAHDTIVAMMEVAMESMDGRISIAMRGGGVAAACDAGCGS